MTKFVADQTKVRVHTQYTHLLNSFRKRVQVFDILIIIGVWLGTLKTRNQFLSPGEDTHRFIVVFISELALPLVWILALQVSGSWDRKSIDSGLEIIRNVFSCAWRAILLAASVSYFLKSNVSRVWFFTTQVLIVVVLLLVRAALRANFEQEVAKHAPPRYLVISKPEGFEETIELVTEEFGTHVQYFRVDPPGLDDGKEWSDKLSAMLEEKQIDGLLLGLGAVSNQILLRELTWRFNEDFSDVVLISKLCPLLPRLSAHRSHTWMRVEEPTIVGAGFFLKRLVDIVLSALALVILAPVMLAIAISIATTSRGNILYIDRRLGKNNKVFNFPKFRTMYEGSDKIRLEVLGRPDEKMLERYKNDPRITPVGRFLRRWSLDELPQLWCVLMGTMSIVGPRPILVEELPQVESNRTFRFVAKPGLTGLWQVNGRKDVDWTDRMMQDVLYIETWSPTRDLVLIIRTIGAILSGKGAY